MESTGKIVSVGSRLFYIHDTRGGCCNVASSYLEALNSQGLHLFSKAYPFMGINRVDGIIKTSDKALFVYGHSVKACDIINGLSFIQKHDTMGNVVYQQTIGISMNFSPAITAAAEYTDGSIYLAVKYTSLFHYSATGAYVSSITIPFGNVTAMHTMANGNLLLSANNGTSGVYAEMTPSGSIVQQSIASNSAYKIVTHPSGQSFFCLTNGGIESLSQNLNVINSYNYTCADFDMINDTIYYTGFDFSQNTPMYGMLDVNLQFLYITGGAARYTYPSGIAICNNKVNIIATSAPPLRSGYNSAVHYQTTKSGILTDLDDVGVLDVRPNNISKVNVTCGNLWTVDADVLVKNTGTTVVDSFYINSYSFCAWCQNLLHKKVYTTLQPGDTVTVNTGNFYTQSIVTVGTSTPATYAPAGLTLWTALPNGRNDAFPQNDVYSFSSDLTGFSKAEPEPLSTDIFPNPVNSKLIIESPDPINTVEIYNTLGALILYSKEETKNWGAEINTETLPRGMYFVKITTGRGAVTKRLIKN